MVRDRLTTRDDALPGEPNLLDEDFILPTEAQNVGTRAGFELTSTSCESPWIHCGHRECIVEGHANDSDEMTDALSQRSRGPCEKLRAEDA